MSDALSEIFEDLFVCDSPDELDYAIDRATAALPVMESTAVASMVDAMVLTHVPLLITDSIRPDADIVAVVTEHVEAVAASALLHGFLMGREFQRRGYQL